jgi:type VI protein secretion system component Hcp
MAAVAYFLKLDRIVGESTDAKHPGEIELESFS